MSSSVTLKSSYNGVTVATVNSTVAETDARSSTKERNEYRLSGFLPALEILNATGITTATMFTLAVRAGTVVVTFTHGTLPTKQYTVTPGYPLHIELPCTASVGPTIAMDPGDGAMVEVLTYLSNDAAVSDEKYLLLKAEDGVTTDSTGQVTGWIDVRGSAKSLAPEPFEFLPHVYLNGTEGGVQKCISVEENYFGTGKPGVRFYGSDYFNGPGNGALQYSGTEFTAGVATTSAWTVVMVLKVEDDGQHKAILSSGHWNGVASPTKKYGAFVGVDGAGLRYFGEFRDASGTFTQEYWTDTGTGDVELTDKPIIIVYRYGLFGGRSMEIFCKGRRTSYTEAWTEIPQFKNKLIIGGAMAFGLGGTPNQILTYQMFKGVIGEIRYYNTAKTDAEIAAIRAELATEYSIDDTPSVDTFPWAATATRLWRANRGVTYDAFSSSLTNIYDTRRSKAADTANYLSRTSSSNTIVVGESQDGIPCAVFGTAATLYSAANPPSNYANSTGASDFLVGCVMEVSNAPAYPVLMGTSTDTVGAYGFTFWGGTSGAGYWNPTIVNQNAGVPTLLDNFQSANAPRFLNVPVRGLFSLNKDSTAGATVRALGQSMSITDAFAEVAVAPSSPLYFGSNGTTPGIPSGGTPTGVTGNWFEAFYMETAFAPALELQWYQYVKSNYGFDPTIVTYR